MTRPKSSARPLGDVSVNFLRLLIDTAQILGATPDPVLRKYKLGEEALQQPQTRVSIQRYMRIGKELIDLSGRADLGLEMGARMQVTTLGLPGYAAMTANSLEHAIRLAIMYERLASRNQQGSSRYYREQIKDRSRATKSNRRLHGVAQLYSLEPYNEFNHFVVDATLAGWFAIARWLTGRSDIVDYVEVEYPQPDYAQAYRAFFGCPVYFGQARNAVLFSESALDLPSLYKHPLTHLQMLGICDEALTRVQVDMTMAERVSEVIRSRLESGGISLLETADQLVTTPWSLRRQLARENTSFNRLLDEVRRNRAELLAKTTNRSLTQISFELGFANPASFHRARRRWQADE
ncbi:AraC family transcriptional regulator ligand-binding domain-containing protein [Allohahella sp. A8]|uniref:AraC family transcriptional regulator n=1 Tax=Allohahella sp. A8 TaxID=3141461 RepID=UPI003A806B32